MRIVHLPMATSGYQQQLALLQQRQAWEWHAQLHALQQLISFTDVQRSAWQSCQ